MMKKIINIVLFTLLAVPVFSLNLSLEECKNLALKNSEEVKIAEKQQKVAAYKKMEYRSNFFPKISLDATYIYKNDPFEYSVEDGYLPNYLYDANSGSLVPDLYIDPSTGQPVIGADGNPLFNQYSYFPGLDLSLSLRNAYLASINVKQPVFMGGKILNAYKMAKIGADAARVNLSLEEENMLIETEIAYWRVVSLQQKIELSNQYEALITEVVKQLSDAYEVGMIQKNNLLKARVKLNEARLNKQKAIHGKELATLALERLIGIDPGENCTLVDTVVTDTDLLDLEVSDEMFSERKDYQLLKAKYEVAKKEKSLAFAEFLPEIAVQGSYSEIRYELNDDERKSQDTTIMATFSLPIFQWGENYAKNQQAKLKRDMAELELERGIELMKLQIKKLEFDREDARLRSEMAESSVKQAEENLRIASDNFELNRSTTTDLLEAQTEWQKAKSELLDARIDQKQTSLQLLQAVGKM
jgi:outer membrane protein TolC